MRKSAPFRVASKLRCKAKDNGFKQVQIAYLTVISYLDIDTTNFRVIRVQRVNTKASLMVEFFNSFS